MDYNNPQVPHEVNDSVVAEGHLKDVIVNLLFVGVATLGITLFLINAGSIVGQYIPFEWEKIFIDEPTSTQLTDQEVQLNDLAQKLSARVSLPEGMSVSVRVNDLSTVNAYASLGGKIVIFKGLLDSVKSDRALAFILAHEISHVKHRHVIQQVGGGLLVVMAYGVITGNTASDSTVLGVASTLSIASYSREREEQADETALAALYAEYGTIDGYDELFQELSKDEPDSLLNVYMRTHKLSSERIKHLNELAIAKGWK